MKHDKLFSLLQDNFKLSDYATIMIIECVEAYDKYIDLPQSTVESLQDICDVFGVSFKFNFYRHCYRLILSGIYNNSTEIDMFTDETFSLRVKKPFKPVMVHYKDVDGRTCKKKAFISSTLNPGSGGVLTSWAFDDVDGTLINYSDNKIYKSTKVI